MGDSAIDLQIGTGKLPKDITQLGLSGGYAAFRYDGEGISPNGTTAMDAYTATLMLRHYFGDGWSADLVVPTGTIRTKTEDTDPLYLSGFGDLRVQGRYDFAGIWGVGGYRPTLALTAGLGLPTGTQAVVGEAGSPFPSNLLALGYGVFSASARLDYIQTVHRILAVKLWGQYRQPLAWSEQGVKYGLGINYGLGLLVRITSWLSAIAQATGQHLEPNKMISTEEENPNSGGDVFAAELELAFKITPRLFTGLTARVPFYANLNTDANGTQLVEKFTGGIYMALLFGIEED